MRLLKALVAGAAGLGLLALLNQANKEEQAKIEENKRRMNTLCSFDGPISYDEFQSVVHSAAKTIRRLKVMEIDGPIVRCSVRSSSGLSTWEFTLDFNDYGDITGKCWTSSDNEESTIPSVFAERIQEELSSYL